MQLQLNAFLTAGYIVYDLFQNANSFHGLLTATPGLYVCVWGIGGSRSSYYDIIPAGDTVANITRHTDVVIFNATVDGQNRIKGEGIISNTFNLIAGDYTNKLKIYGGQTYLKTCAGAKKYKLWNTTVYAIENNIDIEDPVFDFVHLYLSKNFTLKKATTPDDTTIIKNLQIERLSGTIALEIDINVDSANKYFSNIELIGFNKPSTVKFIATQDRVMNFSMFKITNCDNINIQKLYTTDGNNAYFLYDVPEDIDFTASSASKAWNDAPAAFSVNTADYLDFGYDENGTLYVAYQDTAAGTGKLTVDKIVNGVASHVGSAGISAGVATHISMHVVSSTEIYVGYRDGNASNKATMLYWNGTAWVGVGSAGFTATAASFIKVFKDSSYKYLAYKNDTSGYTAEFRYDGSSWTKSNYDVAFAAGNPIGILGERVCILYTNGWIGVCCLRWGGYANDEYTYNKGAAIAKARGLMITGNYYFDVVYIKTTGTKVSAARMKCNWLDFSWTQYGSEDFSNNAADYCDIAMDGSIPHVVYHDTDNGHKATEMVFDGVSAWANEGNPGLSAGTADYLCLLIRNSIPYVAYKDGNSAGKATIKKYAESAVTSKTNYGWQPYTGAIFQGEYKLNFDLIKAEGNYTEIFVRRRPQNVNRDTLGGPKTLNNYSLEQLGENYRYLFKDVMKNMSMKYFLIEKVDEFEIDLVGKTIKNLKFFDGVTEYEYEMNENFLIIASSAERGNAAFMNYNQDIWLLVFTDLYIGDIFTVDGIYIVYTLKNPLNLMNDFPDIANSSVSGDAIEIDACDNEWIKGGLL
jgi:hypothetical protein